MLVVLVLWGCWRGRGRKDEKTPFDKKRCWNWGAKKPHRTWMEMSIQDVVLGEVRWSGRPSCFHCFGTPKRNFFGEHIDWCLYKGMPGIVLTVYDILISCVFTTCTKCWRFQLGIWCHTCYLNDFFHSNRRKRWKPKDWVKEIVLLKMWWGLQFSWLFRVYGGWNTTQLYGEYKKPWHSVSDIRIPI